MLGTSTNENLVSIIMPAYNAEQFIGEAIESILKQTYRNFELLICDDASSDGTKDVIITYNDSRIRLFENGGNIGYLKTCNFLASKASGAYITFQDADDVSHIKRIELQIEAINKRNIDFVGTSRLCNYSSSSEKVVSYPLQHGRITSLFSSVGSRGIFPNTIMFSAEIYQKIGLYREEFNRIGAEDYDWILRVSERFMLGNIPSVCYFYRDNPESISRGWQADEKNLANMSPFIAYKMYLARKKGVDEREVYNKYIKNHLAYPISHLVVCRRLLSIKKNQEFLKLYLAMVKKYKVKVIFYLDFWLIFRDLLLRRG